MAKKSKKKKHRNALWAFVMKTNPKVLMTKFIPAKRGKNRKQRPRQKKWDVQDC